MKASKIKAHLYLSGVASVLVTATYIHAGGPVTIVGDISFAGSAVLNNSVPLATAFNSFSSVKVGTGTQYDNYSSVADNTPATFNAFTFESLGIPVGATTGTLWSFNSGGKNYKFTLTSIDNVVKTSTSTITTLIVGGAGIAHIDGFTDTPASFTITLSKKNSTVTFSSFASVP